MQIQTDELKQAANIYRELLRGYHISHQDHEWYPELSNNQEQYQKLFELLGYQLVCDPRGFYYFLPEETSSVSLNKTAQRFAMIIFILIELYADEGKDSQFILESEYIPRTDFAKIIKNKYQKLLEQVEVFNEQDIESKIFEKLVKFGFASDYMGRGYQMRPPIHRFFDVCLDLHKEAQSKLVIEETSI
ncbi:MAG: chromosome partitioning protein [Candidatus Parabeggiatoa sp. nov. 1]|nr:MAG: chromosome partitioning protein [Gammaproteobacteria bacterium]